MTNSAILLHELMSEWAKKSSSTGAAARGISDSAGWPGLRRGMALLTETLDTFADMKAAGTDTGGAEEYFDRWTAMVVAYPEGWGRAGAISIDKEALGALRLAGSLIGMYVPALSTEQRDEFSALIDALEREIDQTLPDEASTRFLKKHCRSVIGHLRARMDEVSTLGEFRLAQAVADLDLLTQELVRFDKESNGNFSKIREKIGEIFRWSIHNPFMDSAVGELGAETVQRMLPS